MEISARWSALRVTNLRRDVGAISPMLNNIERRTGALPKTLLADGGHLKFDCLRTAEARGVVVLTPVPPPSKGPRSLREACDAPIVAFRARMETPEAKALDRARAGLQAMRVALCGSLGCAPSKKSLAPAHHRV